MNVRIVLMMGRFSSIVDELDFHSIPRVGELICVQKKTYEVKYVLNYPRGATSNNVVADLFVDQCDTTHLELGMSNIKNT